jgi:hypothetical protein
VSTRAFGTNPGTDGLLDGELRVYLPPCTLVNFSKTATSLNNGPNTFRVWLRGLSSSLVLHIGVGIASQQQPTYPATPGTVQLTPVMNQGRNSDRPLWLRPVFQDPASSPVVNTPLAVNIPQGWETLSTSADAVAIDVSMDTTFYALALIEGALQVQVTVEYNGQWPDAHTVRKVLQRVTLQQSSVNVIQNTNGG